jgi:ATP-dependent DNA helicase Rep
VDEGRIDEERRLFYVGITRAREMLTLSYAKRARRFGAVLVNKASRFLGELPQGDLHWQGRDAEADAAATRETAQVALAKLRALLAD